MNVTVKVMIISMITNLGLSVAKIVVGFIGSSGALIADGFHSLSDLITDVFAIVGSWLSNKPADKEHPYGHGKLEYITSLIISIMIILVGGSLVYNGLTRNIIIPSLFVIVVSLFTIIVKLILSGYVLAMGKKNQNNILIASGYESRTDVISSVVVLLAIILMQFSGYVSFLKYSDLIAMIIIGLLVIKIGFSLLKENLSLILDEQVTDEEYLKNIKNIILKNKQISDIDELVIIKTGPYYKIIIEVSMNKNKKLQEVHDILDIIEHDLKNYDYKIKYVTIHVNPSDK